MKLTRCSSAAFPRCGSQMFDYHDYTFSEADVKADSPGKTLDFSLSEHILMVVIKTRRDCHGSLVRIQRNMRTRGRQNPTKCSRKVRRVGVKGHSSRLRSSQAHSIGMQSSPRALARWYPSGVSKTARCRFILSPSFRLEIDGCAPLTLRVATNVIHADSRCSGLWHGLPCPME